MYSLISTPVLGFDLTRMGSGAATAELLETMLAVPAGGWAAATGRLPDETPSLAAARETALRAAAGRPSIRDLPGATTGDDPVATVALLEQAPIGSLDGLLHCLRTDVLVPGRDGPAGQRHAATPPPEPVVTMAADALCATYLRDLLTESDRRELATGWLAVRRHLPAVPVDVGPQHGPIRRLLEAVRSLRPGGLPALAEAAGRMRALGGDWAGAMHSLTWAVHMSGRIRAAATVQLRLVQAVDLAGIPVADRACGVWNLLSGAAQALVVRDLADTDSAAELLSPAVPALGASWLFDD